MRFFVIFLQLIVLYCTSGTGQQDGASATNAATEKSNKDIVERLAAAKYDNPNFVRDRKREETYKPQLATDVLKNQFKLPYHPAWQDFCDPYHCNDYHKTACGLHRKHMRFQWFQSNCHIILNNQCATYRGALKYDIVENKYCQVYVNYLRTECTNCVDDDDDVPICAVSTSNSHVMLFKNRCTMEKENCEKGNTEYEEVKMFLCEFYLLP